MNRSPLLIVNAVAAFLAVAAMWFAVNAPELARHGADDLRLSSPKPEKPRLPPASHVRVVESPRDGVVRALVFGPVSNAAAESALGATPAFRTVFARPLGVRPDMRPDFGAVDLKADGFRVAVAAKPPRMTQYSGRHFLPRDMQSSDRGDATGDGDPALAPMKAPTPTRRPEPPKLTKPAASDASSDTKTAAKAVKADAAASDAASTSKTGATTKPDAGDVKGDEADDAEPDAPKVVAAKRARRRTKTSVADAATSKTAKDFGPTEGMVLLGVFKSRNGDRALVRTPKGGVRTVKRGEEVAGWRVAAIGETTVQLRRASKTRLLELPKDARR